MADCPHTGVSMPECSCRACLEALLDQHGPQPSLKAIPAAPKAEPADVVEIPRMKARLGRRAA